MDEIFSRGMAAATRLTQAGKLAEADGAAAKGAARRVGATKHRPLVETSP